MARSVDPYHCLVHPSAADHLVGKGRTLKASLTWTTVSRLSQHADWGVKKPWRWHGAWTLHQSHCHTYQSTAQAWALQLPGHGRPRFQFLQRICSMERNLVQTKSEREVTELLLLFKLQQLYLHGNIS